MGAELTLGAEEELHLIDLDSWELSARAPQLLSRLPSAAYSAEIQRTTVETNTAVVASLSDLREELLGLRKDLVAVAEREGLGVAAVGTAPRSTFADFELTTTGRYSRMQEQYRLLVDEQLICGTQVHVGVSDRDLAVEISQRIARDLPVLLALSASSPFWNGQDTGYASIRTTIWQRWPTAGSTGPLASAQEYDELLADLIGSGVIADAKMAYFDVRPSSHAPTLEAWCARRSWTSRTADHTVRPLPRCTVPRSGRRPARGCPATSSAGPCIPGPVRRPRWCAGWSSGCVRSWRSSATGTPSRS
jgi:carboxylate-amine ligase